MEQRGWVSSSLAVEEKVWIAARVLHVVIAQRTPVAFRLSFSLGHYAGDCGTASFDDCVESALAAPGGVGLELVVVAAALS